LDVSQSYNTNPLKNYISTLILIVQSLILEHSNLNRNIRFLWVPSHVKILGNEMADLLATSTKSYSSSSYSLEIPFSDFLSSHRNSLNKAWLSSQRSLPQNYATSHREISPSTYSRSWFHHLDLSRSTTVNFSRLRLGYNLLPFH